MEKFQDLKENARKKLSVADHLLLVTYPMLKDPKILLSVAQNIYKSLELGMNSSLEHEILFKKIGLLPESFHPRLDVFKELAPRMGFSIGMTSLLEKFRDIVDIHSKSAVEFPRKDKFIIGSDDYELETLDFEALKQDIKTCRSFLDVVDKVVSKNERIFG